MNTYRYDRSRKLRVNLPRLEQLDARIVPAGMHAAAAAAHAAAETPAQVGTAVTDSARGLLRHEIILQRRIERRDRALARLEAREARLRRIRGAASPGGGPLESSGYGRKRDVGGLGLDEPRPAGG